MNSLPSQILDRWWQVSGQTYFPNKPITNQINRMNQTSINQQLLDLYSSKWDKLSFELQSVHDNLELDIKPANPLLLYVDDEVKYNESEIKIMIFGQETNGWFEEKDVSIEKLQILYDEFFNKGEAWTYGGQFWNGVNRLIKSLQQKYPEKKIKLIWNNTVKIGKKKEKGMPPDYIYEIERNFFRVIPQEVQILKPNIIIFFSGPNYDNIIKDNFGEMNYQTCSLFSSRELGMVEFPGVQNCFRTYHPNFLFRNNIDDYLESIVESIKL